MPDYKELYFELFNKVTDIIEELKKFNAKWKKSALKRVTIENNT